uniref:Uncharacterized protein n=1 Tax=mine drainage metagenome TaxID=410659 RepID=E6PH22_9ZZZZ
MGAQVAQCVFLLMRHSRFILLPLRVQKNCISFSLLNARRNSGDNVPHGSCWVDRGTWGRTC